MQNISMILLGIFLPYIIEIFDLGISMLQAKVALFNTGVQCKLNKLAEEEMKGQELSHNMGFHCPDDEEDYEDDWDDDDEYYDDKLKLNK